MTRMEMEKLINKFHNLTDKPVKYLTVQNDIKEDIKNLVKSLYDFTKSQEQSDKPKSNQTLKELIVDDFDEEQIWQQIELQNSQCWDKLVWDVANSMSNKSDLTFPVKFSEESDDENSEMELNDPPEDSGDDIDNEIVTEKRVKKKNKSKTKSNLSKKTSIVDDQFFKLQDMESFLLNEEKKEGKVKKNIDGSDEESIDLFDDIDSEGTEDEERRKEMMYSDFFNEGDYNSEEVSENDNDEEYDSENFNTEDIEEKGKVNGKKVRFAEPETDESDSDDDSKIDSNKLPTESNEKKSEFELRQQRLKQQISRLEEKTLKEAPWQLKGEIDAGKRPQNSLLEEVLDFDLTTRPPPTITEQTTVTLEGLIKQRVKDKAWDDVVKKEKPVDDQLLFKKPEVLDQSKSKLSLAQVYEAEYLKQKQAKSGEVIDEKEPEGHTEIRDLMTKLFSKLDALCHYHYTPKAPQPDIKIISNTPAISMEEVAPVATSDAALLAPEEVKRKRKGDFMSKEERTQTDKNRARRRLKRLQRKKGQVNKVTDNRNTKKATETNDKSLKTSKAFFQELNDNATSIIKNKSKNVIKNKGQ